MPPDAGYPPVLMQCRCACHGRPLRLFDRVLHVEQEPVLLIDPLAALEACQLCAPEHDRTRHMLFGNRIIPEPSPKKKGAV